VTTTTVINLAIASTFLLGLLLSSTTLALLLPTARRYWSSPAVLNPFQCKLFFNRKMSSTCVESQLHQSNEKSHYDYAQLVTKPLVSHVLLSEADMIGVARLIVIGDIHGCLDELHDILFKCSFNPDNGDRVVLVGDLVNKGPYSLEVVRYARTNNFLSVRGNHDDFALCHAKGLVPKKIAPQLAYIQDLNE
jgi:hypothetical protein